MALLRKEQDFSLEISPPESLREVVFLAAAISNAGEKLKLEIPAYPKGKKLAKEIREKVNKMKTEIFPLVEKLQTQKENFQENLAELDQQLWILGFRNPWEENLVKGDSCLLFLNLLKKTPLEIFLATTYFASKRNDVDYIFCCVKVAEIDKVSGKINLVWKEKNQEISYRPLYPNQRRVIKISIS